MTKRIKRIITAVSGAIIGTVSLGCLIWWLAATFGGEVLAIAFFAFTAACIALAIAADPSWDSEE